MSMQRSMPAIDAATWARDSVERGARFVGLFADVVEDHTELHYLVSDDQLRSAVGVVNGSVPSIAAAVPAASWHEREVRDRFTIAFDGQPDPRPLLPPGDAAQFRRSTSPEVSTLLYGPVRSGIVESARWIIDTAGEDFLSVYPSMFFKQRGLEERFEGTDLELAPFVAEHVSGATAVSHAVAFCRALERALHIEVPPRALAAQSILMEFERVHQHLDSLAKLADDASLSVGSAQTFAAKERIHRLLADATGNRFSRGVICVGGVRDDVFGTLQETCNRLLEVVERETLAVVEALFHTQSLLDRLIGTGRLSAEIVQQYGGVGPLARGSGVSSDVRRHEWTFTPLTGDEVLEIDGDAMARSLVRRREIHDAFRIIRNALDAAPVGPHRASVPSGVEGSALARVESPQGELVYYVRLDRAGLRRVAIRSASYANWPLFAPALPGNIFTDFSFTEHSFGLIQAETDR